MGPAHPFQRIEHGFGDRRRKRADQLIEPEFSDHVGGGTRRIAGGRFQLIELQLRDPDRILVAHALRHQPGDLAEHRLVDAFSADEAPHAIDVKLGVARALIVDQQVNAVADIGDRAVGQSLRQKWRRGVVVADDIGEQITERGEDACHLGLFRFCQAGFGAAEADAACCASRSSSFPMFSNSRALASRRK